MHEYWNLIKIYLSHSGADFDMVNPYPKPRIPS